MGNWRLAAFASGGAARPFRCSQLAIVTKRPIAATAYTFDCIFFAAREHCLSLFCLQCLCKTVREHVQVHHQREQLHDLDCEEYWEEARDAELRAELDAWLNVGAHEVWGSDDD